MINNRFLGVLLASTVVCTSVNGDPRPIDLEKSSLTVHVFKSGVFSAFGDNHEISAPITSGSVEDGAAAKVEIAVNARQMTVLDPALTPEKRAEVQKRMLGPEVLDVARFAEIRFRSTAVTRVAAGHWRVEGELSLHGKSVALTFEVTEEKGRLLGTAIVSQKAFGIQPISAGGGTVKVRDDVKVDFAIVLATAPLSG